MSQYRNKKKDFNTPSTHSLTSNPKSLHTNPELLALRRTSATLLALAVTQLFPDVLLAGGGLSDIGFYYDFVFTQPLPLEMLSLIETRLKSLAKSEPEIRSQDMMRENASQLFLHYDQPLLAELALAQEHNIVPILQISSCYDLSPPPHALSSLPIKFLKLLSITKETKGEECSEPYNVTRLSGTLFLDPKTLKEFNKSYEIQKKTPITLWGKELDLFTVLEEGIYWHPKGEQLRQLLLNSSMQHNQEPTSQPVSTPLSKNSVFSEHLKLFSQLAPVTLPLKINETRPVFFNPPYTTQLFTGEVGLSDQTTYFCHQEQILPELISSLQLIEQFLIILGFDYCRYLHLSRQPRWLIQAMEQQRLEYFTVQSRNMNLCSSIEWRLLDSLGREWKGPSITMTELSSGVIAIGRSFFDSVDRIVGLLLDRYQGQLPFRLAPEQIRILSLGNQNTFTEGVVNECRKHGYRVGFDGRDDKLAAKIHAAEKEQIPYIIIIGDKERNQKRITVRHAGGKPLNTTVTLESFLLELKQQLNGCEST